MIRLEAIHKTYNRGTAAEVSALSNINLVIAKGEFVTVLGANGSGKSTLLNVLSGSVFPDEGNIYIAGTNVTTLPEYRRSKWIARVFQNPLAGTVSELTIFENFRLAAIRAHPKNLTVGTTPKFRLLVRDKIAGLGLGLENKTDALMGTLSGGQRQALTLLMAVMDDASLVLLDEPTAALDPKTSARIMTLADRIIREHGLTAILVTHNLKDAATYGSRILLMSEGKITKDVARNESTNPDPATLLDWF